MNMIPLVLLAAGVIQLLRKTLNTAKQLPEWDKILSKVWAGSIVYALVTEIPYLGFLKHGFLEIIFLIILYTLYQLREQRDARLYVVAVLPLLCTYLVIQSIQLIAGGFFEAYAGLFDTAKTFTVLWFIGFGIYAAVQNNKERKTERKQEEQIRQAEARKAALEHLVQERTQELTLQKEELEKALSDLKAAQNQLVQSEKMASLGELTAGIAHEIQNPLNFVNNFSELSVELAEELREVIDQPEPDTQLIRELAGDLIQNQQKINHHGKRASGIVTAMLQHARSGGGKKEPTDLNVLADEYLRLAYHGLRAKDASFTAKMVTEFDPALGLAEVIPQDMGRVLLNLINNAFYAVRGVEDPTVTVSTQKTDSQIIIKVKDNGAGIPEALKGKIFQPFFTTKPTGQGTGLGLSLAYDIVTKGHGGSMSVSSTENKGTEFVITLPV